MVDKKTLQKTRGSRQDKFVTTFANSHLLSDKHLRPWISDSNWESKYSREVDEFEQTLFFVSPYKSFQSGPLDRKSLNQGPLLRSSDNHAQIQKGKILPSPISNQKSDLSASRLSEDTEVLEMLEQMKAEEEDATVEDGRPGSPCSLGPHRKILPSASATTLPQLGGDTERPRRIMSLSQSQPILGLTSGNQMKRFNEPRKVPRPATAASSRHTHSKHPERAKSANKANREKRDRDLRTPYQRPENKSPSRSPVKNRYPKKGLGQSQEDTIESYLEKRLTGQYLRKVHQANMVEANKRKEINRVPRSASWMPRFGSESNSLNTPTISARIRQRVPTPYHTPLVPRENLVTIDGVTKDTELSDNLLQLQEQDNPETSLSFLQSDLRDASDESMKQGDNWAEQRQSRPWSSSTQGSGMKGKDGQILTRNSSHGFGDSAWKKTSDELSKFTHTRSKKDHTWQLMGQNGAHENENAWRSEHKHEFRMTKEFKEELDRAPVFPEYNIQSSETRLWGEMAIRQGIPMYVSGSMGGNKKV